MVVETAGTTQPLHVIHNTTSYRDIALFENEGDPGTGSTKFVIKNSRAEFNMSAYGSTAPGVLADAALLSAASGSKLLIGSNTGMEVQFFSNNSWAAPNFAIDVNGDIGMGTITPGVSLHVKRATGAATLWLEADSGNAHVALDRDATDDMATIVFYTAGSANWWMGTPDSDLYSGDGTDFFIGTTSGTPMFLIDTAGDVAIGTNDPLASLHVKRTSAGASLLVESDNGSARLIADRSSAAKPCSLVFRTAGTPNWYLGSPDSDDYSGDGSDFYIGVAEDTPLFLIDTSGNVGIGTNDPSYLLDSAEIGNSGGSLKIQADVEGDVTLFEDTDVGDAVDGKKLIVYRKAAEFDTEIQIYLEQDGAAIYVLLGI